jgi:diguanylate cyclase (GGDEF)-like protein
MGLLEVPFILTAGYVLIGMALYEYTHRYAEDQNKKKLDQILLNQRALHSYIEDVQKPVYYKLKEEGKLYKEFFDPKVLSFTYIARGIHERLNNLRVEENTTKIYYKLATDNPRNPVNKADQFELKTLNMFRTKANDMQYSEIIHENGHSYIYYAMPVERNKESCMKCHSSPDKAPRELIKQYGSEAGFGESVGNLRAIISLKMPFDDELAEANEIFQLIMLILTVFLLILFGVIIYFFKKLDQSQRLIEEKNKKLTILAQRDSLTGIYNRRSFENDLKNMIVDESVVLMILDIDYFKKINDTHGHQTGDRILKELADLVNNSLRDTDHFYRIGGEEFAILTIQTSIEEIKTMIQRLMYTINEHDFIIDEHVHVSIGIAFKKDSDDFTSLFKRADSALYIAKEAGRNQYVIND